MITALTMYLIDKVFDGKRKIPELFLVIIGICIALGIGEDIVIIITVLN